jgi:hypothetical protein
MFSKKSIGSEVFFIKWSRSSRGVEPVIESGTLTKIGRVNISINNDVYKIKQMKDFCTLASRGCLSDSSIEIYKSKEDVEKQRLASVNRRNLISVCSDRQNLEKLSLAAVEQILQIIDSSNKD